MSEIMNRHPVYIATKGRAGKAKVVELMRDNTNFALVVEPQEFDAYVAAYPSARVMTLPKNDQGVTFARQWILDFARNNGDAWFWMMDDDISGFFEIVNKRAVRKPAAEILMKAERLVSTMPGVAVAALEYQQYAWSATKPWKFNSYCDVAVLINVANTLLQSYTPEVKEDRDFVLQALSNGYLSMRTCHLAFAAPKNGSNAGGLHDDYAAGKEMKWSQNMIAKWPAFCTMNVKPDGRPDVKINWKLFKPNAAPEK